MNPQNQSPLPLPPTIQTDDIYTIYQQILNSPANSNVAHILLSTKFQFDHSDAAQILFSRLKYDNENNCFNIPPTRELVLYEWEQCQLNMNDSFKEQFGLIQCSEQRSDYVSDIRTDFFKTFKEYGINKISEGSRLIRI
jgi:hypothetical protein